MTANKPGAVTQQPLYGCTSCYEECTYPADHLHVYDNECWCDLCWDERRWDFPDQPDWSDLEPYTPALHAECKALVEALEAMLAVRVIEADASYGLACAKAEQALAAHRQGGEE